MTDNDYDINSDLCHGLSCWCSVPLMDINSGRDQAS